MRKMWAWVWTRVRMRTWWWYSSCKTNKSHSSKAGAPSLVEGLSGWRTTLQKMMRALVVRAAIIVLVTRGMGATAAAMTMKTMSELLISANLPCDASLVTPSHTGVSLNHIRTFSLLLLCKSVTTSYLLHFASFFVVCSRVYYTHLPVVVEFVLYIY